MPWPKARIMAEHRRSLAAAQTPPPADNNVVTTGEPNNKVTFEGPCDGTNYYDIMYVMTVTAKRPCGTWNSLATFTLSVQ
jgi:hypothetical protein